MKGGQIDGERVDRLTVKGGQIDGEKGQKVTCCPLFKTGLSSSPVKREGTAWIVMLW